MPKKTIEAQAADFAILQSAMDQRRQRFLFNVPQPRLTLESSPYSMNTKDQIDMRRKIEILSYSGVKSGSGKIGLTKRAAWTALAKSGRSAGLSQMAIQDYVSSGAICPANKLLPTLTTACDVPGPPMVLQLDPSVPLYGYATDTVRTFATQIIVDYNLFRLDTKNEIDFLAQTSTYLMVDSLSSEQSRNESIGSILMNPRGAAKISTFGLSFPLAVWLTGVQTAEYASTLSSSALVIRITSIVLEIYYNSTLKTSVNVEIASLMNPSLTISSFDQGFYAIQYVGMVDVPPFELTTQAGDVFTLRASIGYSYNLDASTQLFLLQTGVFANVSSANIKHTHNCAFSTNSPTDYSPGSFVFYPDSYIHVHNPV
jgi:hypothetical protein